MEHIERGDRARPLSSPAPTLPAAPDQGGAVPGNLPQVKVTQGTAIAYFETGTEGLLWMVEPTNCTRIADLHFLQKGDFLRVEDPAGQVLFEGTIDPDYDAGKMPRYAGDKYGQPVARGYWVHWTQKGWTPDDWAMLFIPEKNRAVATKASDAGLHSHE